MRLGRKKFSIREVKMSCVRLDQHPITAAVIHHGPFDMIVGGPLMKSFAGFVQYGVLSWVPVCFVEVEGAIFVASD